MHDITFFRGGKAGKQSTWHKSSLYNNAPSGVKFVGDSAYTGQPDKVTTTLDAHSKTTKTLFGRIKSLNETANGRLKNFKVVRDSFRHGKKDSDDKMAKIRLSFEAAAVLVEYDIENGHSLFEV